MSTTESFEELLTGNISKRTVEDSEHKGVKDTDMEPPNQGNTEHSKSEAEENDSLNDIKSESLSDTASQTSGPLPNAATQTSAPVLPDTATQTSGPALVDGTSQTSGPSLPNAATQTSGPSLPNAATQTSAPVLPDTATQTSGPALVDGTSQTSGPALTDSAAKTGFISFVEASRAMGYISDAPTANVTNNSESTVTRVEESKLEVKTETKTTDIGQSPREEVKIRQSFSVGAINLGQSFSGSIHIGQFGSECAYIDQSSSEDDSIGRSTREGVKIGQSTSGNAKIDQSSSEGAKTDQSPSEGSNIGQSVSESAKVGQSASEGAKIDPSSSKGARGAVIAAYKVKFDFLTIEIPDNRSVAATSVSSISPRIGCFRFLKWKSNKKFNVRYQTASQDFVPGTRPNSEDYSTYYDSYWSPQGDEEIKHFDYNKLSNELIFPVYLSVTKCKKLLEDVEKVMPITTDMLVKDVFKAALNNNVTAFPIRDPSSEAFLGMFTLTDFIRVLSHYYHTNRNLIKDVENQTVDTCRRITKASDRIVQLESIECIFIAAKQLIQERIHRLLVTDTEKNAFLVTKRGVLFYMISELFILFAQGCIKFPSSLFTPIGDLKIGTYKNIVKIRHDTKLIKALDLFIRKGVSCLPVVTRMNRLIDIFEKKDVFQLAEGPGFHNLKMRVKDVIVNAKNREGFLHVTLKETFGRVIVGMIENEVHRVLVVNNNKNMKLVGIISLSDILKFLILDPCGDSGLPFTLQSFNVPPPGLVRHGYRV